MIGVKRWWSRWRSVAMDDVNGVMICGYCGNFGHTLDVISLRMCR